MYSYIVVEMLVERRLVEMIITQCKGLMMENIIIVKKAQYLHYIVFLTL